METLSPDVAAELRAGRSTRERKLAVCSGTVPLAPADRVELLCILAFDADEMVANRAKDVLVSQPHESFLLALARPDAPPSVFHWCARHVGEKPGVADAMAGNRNCPVEYLLPVARHLTTPSVQLLVQELDRISALPALAGALELSASVTAEQKQLLHELRGEAFDSATLEQLLKEGNDPEKRLTVSQQINKMTVPQRIQMALKGDTEARRILIRDSSKVVQRAVLQSPRLTEREIEAFSAETGQSEEVLRHIANDRNYRKNYTIIRNLMFNAKTPIDVTLHMLLLLNPTDVKLLAGNRNIPEPLRKAALKLFRQRQIDRHLNE